ncbi:hypothetical protein E6O75_ATG08146 [Venturia nashicola]|uniref:Uncharacterized protein n=1 Tax=Venturia nashicola TaxID=86259 RepID=A0A4Z1P118_9PEZI|nr:hypothetical protein E6O75_ATG08146 [Venturia nashicola]
MSGNSNNSAIDYVALDNMTQAELEGDNDFATPLIGRDFDAAHGISIGPELIADEDIPEASLGSPLLGSNQGLYSNITLGGSIIIPSETTDSTFAQNSYVTGHGDESMYGANVTTEAFAQEGPRTPPNMQWVIGTFPRQYRPISSSAESEDEEDRCFIAAPSSSNHERINAFTAFIGTDIRAATGSMIPQMDASGRPTHFVDENGVPYTSGLFMFQKCITHILKCIEGDRYLHAQNALYEVCTLYTHAASITRYKQIGSTVNNAKEMEENDGIPNLDSQASISYKIQQHIDELLAITKLTHDFLDSNPFTQTGGTEVEKARVACLKLLVSRIVEVQAMEKTCRSWERVECFLQEMAQAVYELGVVCAGCV